MPTWVAYLPVLLVGFGLGAVFFGGLWLTVRRLPTARRPTLLALGSFWVRTAVVVAGFVFTMAGRWQNAAVCLAGFVLARIALARWAPHGASKGKAA